MKNKFLGILVCLMLVLTAIVFVPDDLKVKATPGGGGGGDNGSIGLDYSFIYNVTKDLSEIINSTIVYPPGTIPKGRAFGTAGEHFAAEKINVTMNGLGLYNVTLEQIKDIQSGYDLSNNLTNKLEILSQGITVHNKTSSQNNTLADFHIFPRWNASFINLLLEPFPRLYNQFHFDQNILTHNFSYNNLTVKQRTYEIRGWIGEIICEEVEYLKEEIENENITNLIDIIVFIMKQLENESNFTFDDLDQNPNNITTLEWYNTYNDSTRGGCDPVDFVFIEEDPSSPTYTAPEWRTCIKNCLGIIASIPLLGYVDRGATIIEMLLWSIANRLPWTSNCRGLLLYDFNNDTYNMAGTHLAPLPILNINNSIGTEINETVSNFTIYFHINQNWNTTVESYNVIGQINGTNPESNETVIVGCLYDSWWCQGTADSAIGMAMVLGIAKYFKDYNIKPKYNLKFIAFGGEEYGSIGAYYHEAANHPDDEKVITFIDLNQLGFKQTYDPRLTLYIFSNNESINNTVTAIADETNYVDRTGDTADFKTHFKEVSYLGNYHPYLKINQNYTRSTNTVYFVKDTGWTLHHRDGLDHTEGDVIDYYDPVDANVTTEMIWNVTKYFTVDPDCWLDSHTFTSSDTDDDDNLNDTVTFDYDIKSTLPHDLAMVNYSLWKITTNKIIMSKVMNFTVNRTKISKSVNITLPSGESPGFYNIVAELYNSTGRINEILNSTGDNANQSESSGFLFLYPYGYNLTPPVITNVSSTPDPVGYGFNVTINADVTSNVSTIDTVTVNVSYPDNTINSYNMSNTVGDTYEYVFNDTWQYRQYDYVIWAKDSNGNESGSSQYSFNVSAEANISVCTVKDSYGGGEIINLTDPPGNNKGISQQIGYELLDNNEVLRVWNRYDNYYFNTSSGIQLTNHYDEYWSHNVLMLGYYNNDEWNLIYRTDELSGFNKNINSDNETFVNATLWKDLSYEGYDFRLAIRYHLGVDDNELTIIPYIKNIDDEDIPYNLGFAWEIKDIQVDMTTIGDYIEINGTTYYLNQELDETYKNMAIPCFYIREDISGDKSESLYLRWNENLNYVVRVKSREGQYNAPVILGIKIGTLNISQEKYTNLFWHDASEVVYYFDEYTIMGEEWATNPANMIDGNISNYASTTFDGDVELCINNTCTGTNLGTISKVEIRCYGYYSYAQRDIILRPVFYGKDGDNHNYVTPPSGDWSPWFDITYDNNAPLDWIWYNIRDLFCDVQSGTGILEYTLYCSKVEIRVTYNIVSVISDPYPANGSTGISITPVLNITVYDAENDLMNITWLSNSSGSWQVFGTNSSVETGTYHQTFSNATENGQWWYWKVNVSDGSSYSESDVFSFYTGNKSKIDNTGSTNFSGYLLMQIEYYNTSLSDWVVDMVVVNETTPRTISVGGVLALDTIFNAQNVNTSTFNNGNGTYRVYACLRNPDDNVLYAGPTQGESEVGYLEAWYEFTVTYD